MSESLIIKGLKSKSIESGFNALFLWYEKRQKKCLTCGSLNTHRKGTQNGKQRYQCQDCGVYFSFKNPKTKLNNQFIWFEKWIMERQVYKTLIRDSKMSQSSLQRLFNTYLSSAPIIRIKSKTRVHLLIDATYFSNGLCVILYYDHKQVRELFYTSQRKTNSTSRIKIYSKKELY